MRAVLSVVALISIAESLGACGGRALKAADSGAEGRVIPDAAVCGDAGAPDAGALGALPLGVYTGCTSRVVQAGSTADGSGGTISLTASGDLLTVEVQKGVLAFATGTLTFTPITASAAVAAQGQTVQVSNVPCTTSTVEFGALALEMGQVALSLVGQGCGQAVSATLLCTVPVDATDTLPPPPPSPCAPADQLGCGCAPPAFAVGAYGPCSASIAALGGGTVTAAESDGVVTATLDGLTSIAPKNATLRFAPTTRTSATIVPGQSWDVSVPGAFAPTVPDTISITSGTIVIDGAMLFAFVGGTDAANTDLQESFHCGPAN